MNKEIIICLQGGVVTAVFCSDKEYKVKILDWDNDENGEEDAEKNKNLLEHAEDTLHIVY